MSATPAANTAESLSQEAFHPYFNKIVHYARAWQGMNYEAFASYISPQSGRKEQSSAEFRMVTIQTIGSDGSRIESNNVDDPRDLWSPQHNQESVNAGSIQIVFLRGLLTPSCMLDIGSQLDIDPEYFRRHMNFLPQSFQAFDMPTSRSSSLDFPCFKINTIFPRMPYAGRDKNMDQSRAEETDALRWHYNHVNSTLIPGDSIARRILVLDEELVALEQHVSVSVKHRKDGNFYLIMWFDNGRSMTDSTLERALNTIIGVLTNKTIPVAHFEPLATLGPKGFTYPDTRSPPIFQQSADLLMSNYGVSLDPRLMRIDVMYTLSELLRFCHSSEIQFLNAIDSRVRVALQSPSERVSASDGVSEASFRNLWWFKNLLDTHVDYLQETLSFIEQPRDTSWPSAKEVSDIDVVRQILSSLRDDYTHTLERAKSMVQRIVEGTEMHTNAMMLTESKKAILQAESTTRLTLLAAFFLPINLVTSFFGMNFKQFGQGSLHIWIAFACMGTMLLASSVALLMSKPNSYRRSILWRIWVITRPYVDKDYYHKVARWFGR